MKKLLFLMIVGFGGSMLVKGGHVTITPDNQVKVAGYTVPLPAAIQNSPIMGMIGTVFMGQLQSAQMAGPAGQPGAPMRPYMPNVSSANTTYNANAPSPGPQSQAAQQFGAVAKALH